MWNWLIITLHHSARKTKLWKPYNTCELPPHMEGWVSEGRGTSCQPWGQRVVKRFSMLQLPEDGHVGLGKFWWETWDWKISGTHRRNPVGGSGFSLWGSVGSFQAIVPGWAGMVQGLADLSRVLLSISDGDIAEEDGNTWKLWSVVQKSYLSRHKKSLVRFLSSLGYLGSIHII